MSAYAAIARSIAFPCESGSVASAVTIVTVTRNAMTTSGTAI